MTKITIVGAGSTVFMKNIVGDILLEPLLKQCELALLDIDEKRLTTSVTVASRLAEAVGAHPKITATIDRRRALAGANYVILMIQVATGRQGAAIDFEIAKRHGLRQTIGDTVGIGGIMRALRTIPLLVDIASDVVDLCPLALVLQYVNPMAMNCMALARFVPIIRTIGLCHSVQATIKQLAHDINVPIEEIRFLCAGINHMAFYLTFERRLPNGDIEDLYPRVRQVIDENRVPDSNRVRYEVLRHFGYFVTESSEHFAEYVPWFIKRDRPDLIEKFNIPFDESIRRYERRISRWENQETALASGGMLKVQRSHEYAARIIMAELTGKPVVINGNVANNGYIDNLPSEACVEIPCLIDHNGVQPIRVGKIPPQLAALMQTNINVQELTVEAIVNRSKDHAKHAAMLDPHTAAELSLQEISDLVDELFDAHDSWASLSPIFR